jgi:thiol:disulfide interchange protein
MVLKKYCYNLYMNVFLAPSFYAHLLNGLLLVCIFYLVFFNWQQLTKLDPYRQLVLILLLSATLGIHGLSHLGLEKLYNYNPLHSIQ